MVGGGTKVRLHDVGVTGRLWHFISNLLCGTLSQVRVGDSSSQSWVDTVIAQGRVLSPLLFNLLVDSLAAAIRSAVCGVRLMVSDPFRLVCQLHADDLVILAVQQLSVQFTLGALAGGSPFVLVQTSRSRSRCLARWGMILPQLVGLPVIKTVLQHTLCATTMVLSSTISRHFHITVPLELFGRTLVEWMSPKQLLGQPTLGFSTHNTKRTLCKP